jgi:cytochrome c2
LSANRAYVTAETQYSKAQKDAVRYLTTFVHNKNINYWKFYLREKKVIEGAKLTLVTLNINPEDKMVKVNLRAGRKKEQDLDNIIGFLKNLEMFPYFPMLLIFGEKPMFLQMS